MSSRPAPDPAAAAEATRPFSLGARLALTYASAAFLLVAASAIVLERRLVAGLEKNLDALADHEGAEIEKLLLEPTISWSEVGEEVRLLSGLKATPKLHVRIREAGGVGLAAETEGMSAELPARPLAIVHDRAALRSASGTEWEWLRKGVRRADGRAFEVEVAIDRTEHEAFITRFRATEAAVLIGALVLSSVGGYAIARRGVRPVEAVTEAARRIGSTTLGERLDVRGAPAEIARLAATFNGMLDRLEDAFHRLAAFGADLAHELRTPLQNLRGAAEVVLLKPERAAEEYRDALAGVIEECDRLGRIVDDLLLLARAETQAEALEKSAFDAGEELEALRAYFEASAAAKGVRLELHPAGPTPLRADRLKVRRIIANLIDNAIKYTPAGGAVVLRASNGAPALPASPSRGEGRGEGAAAPSPAAPGAGAVEVAVEDTGPGVSPADLPHVFERFYRAEKSRSRSHGGAGLGLAICRMLARAHGGDVRLEPRPGGGTRAVLRLPTLAGAVLAVLAAFGAGGYPDRARQAHLLQRSSATGALPAPDPMVAAVVKREPPQEETDGSGGIGRSEDAVLGVLGVPNALVDFRIRELSAPAINAKCDDRWRQAHHPSLLIASLRGRARTQGHRQVRTTPASTRRNRRVPCSTPSRGP